LSQLDLAIVLAAGEGTRMKSTPAKVLHEISGRSLLDHVLHAIAPLQAKEVRVVVGASKDEVIAHLKEVSPASRTVLQEVRGGTGHAVKLALENYSGSGSVLVCAGDTPLLTSETLTNLFNAHNSSKASATVLTTEMPDPSGYGRVIRDNDGNLAEIVEERDATESQKQTLEINSGVYIFDLDELRVALSQLSASNSQKEEYLTDVIAILKKSGKKVGAFSSHDFTEILGINDRSQLSTVRIEPGTAIKGKCKIGKSAVIGPRTTLIHCNVGSNAHIFESHCDSSAIGANAVVGPYSHLRSGTVLAGNVKVGSFVEIKNSTVGESSKVPHLSYVGDATIGTESNIGAATVIVNYDGVEKHQTTIGDHVRIGSDSMLVAPVTIGDGAYTAAGSVITEDVPPGALGMGRAKQTNILGWVLKKRKGTKSAEAAAKKEGSK